MTLWRRLRRWVAPGSAAGKRPDGTSAQTGVRSIARELIALAWPIAAAMFGETALGLVDTKLVGGLGPSALGGVGIATMLMYLNYATVFGLMRGVKVRTAYATGRGSPQDGIRYAQAGALLGVAAGLCVFWIGRDVSWLLRLIGIDSSLTPISASFLAAITWGAPATCALAALINHRQGLGDSRSPMLVGIGGNVVNALLSYGLIYGHFGLPALGVRGGGFGTATTEWLELLVMLALLARDTRRARSVRLIGVRQAVREVADLGVPTGLQFLAEMLAFSTFTAILGNMGGAQIAAHQIALATIRTSFLPGIAVGEAACVLVGQSLAKNRLDEADVVTKTALSVAVLFMAACGVVFAVFGGALARAFTTDGEVARVAQRLLWVAAGFQVLDAVNIVLRGSLRGAKDVRVAAFIGIAVVWTCVPTMAFVLGKLAGWGALGGWCGFVLETLTASALFWRRWTRGAWRREFGGAPSREERPAELVAA
jgi:multidrug resistance protein, MATE family